MRVTGFKIQAGHTIRPKNYHSISKSSELEIRDLDLSLEEALAEYARISTMVNDAIIVGLRDTVAKNYGKMLNTKTMETA